MKCNANVPAPCPFCGRNLLQQCEAHDVTDTDGCVVGRFAYIYWKHPDVDDCPLGFGLVLLNDADAVKHWNHRRK